MLLGKRPRPPIKRTTSMTGITVDIPNVESSSDGSDHHHHQIQIQTQTQNNPHATVSSEVLPPSSANNHDHQQENLMMMNFGTRHHDHQRYLTAMVSPRNYNNQQLQRERSRSSSNDFMETAHFLKTCGLCRRRLHPAQDIYMYRGDTAFCSLECREQQMKQDERKEKIAAGKNNNNNKEESHKNNAAAESSKKSQTVAAA